MNNITYALILISQLVTFLLGVYLGTKPKLLRTGQFLLVPCYGMYVARHWEGKDIHDLWYPFFRYNRQKLPIIQKALWRNQEELETYLRSLGATYSEKHDRWVAHLKPVDKAQTKLRETLQ